MEIAAVVYILADGSTTGLSLLELSSFKVFFCNSNVSATGPMISGMQQRIKGLYLVMNTFSLSAHLHIKQIFFSTNGYPINVSILAAMALLCSFFLSSGQKVIKRTGYLINQGTYTTA